MLDPLPNLSPPAQIAHPVLLWQKAADDAGASVAPNTLRTYRDGCRRFESENRLVCRLTESDPVPVTDGITVDAVRSMHNRNLSYSTIATSIAAVRWAAKVLGVPDPIGTSCERALKAIKRHAPAQTQADPLTWQLADEVVATAVSDTRPDGSPSVAGLRDGAIVAVMSDGMLRISEVAALRIPDIDRRSDGAATILIRRDKTSKGSFDGSTPLFLGAPTIARIDEWLHAVGLDATFDQAVLFRRIYKDGSVARCTICDRGDTGCCRYDVTPHPCCAHAIGSSLCLIEGGCCLHSSGPHRCCKHPMGAPGCAGVPCCLHLGGCDECRCRAALSSRSIHRIITMRAPDAKQADKSFARHETSEAPSHTRTRRGHNHHHECEEPEIQAATELSEALSIAVELRARRATLRRCPRRHIRSPRLAAEPCSNTRSRPCSLAI